MRNFERFKTDVDGLLVEICGETFDDYPRPVDLKEAYCSGWTVSKVVEVVVEDDTALQAEGLHR